MVFLINFVLGFFYNGLYSLFFIVDLIEDELCSFLFFLLIVMIKIFDVIMVILKCMINVYILF